MIKASLNELINNILKDVKIPYVKKVFQAVSVVIDMVLARYCF